MRLIEQYVISTMLKAIMGTDYIFGVMIRISSDLILGTLIYTELLIQLFLMALFIK